MSVVLDPSGLYIDIRASGIVGYGSTPDEATQMANAVEAARLALAKTHIKPALVRRYKFNYQAWRFEPVLETQ